VSTAGNLTVGGSAVPFYYPGGAWAGVNGAFAVAGTLSVGSNLDTLLVRDAAGALAQRNGLNFQTFRIYGTFTDASNYERGFVRWSAAGGNFEIGTEGAGTGSGRHMTLRAGANTFTFFNNGEFSSPTSIRITNRMVINSQASGIVAIRNDAGSDFNRLQFGGTTSLFPALKRDNTVLQARLANDSDFAPLQGQLRTHANAVTETITADKTLILYDAAGTAYKVPCVAA
jgi:hypothetical protein